jgi:hypothetical protein
VRRHRIIPVRKALEHRALERYGCGCAGSTIWIWSSPGPQRKRSATDLLTVSRFLQPPSQYVQRVSREVAIGIYAVDGVTSRNTTGGILLSGCTSGAANTAYCRVTTRAAPIAAPSNLAS